MAKWQCKNYLLSIITRENAHQNSNELCLHTCENDLLKYQEINIGEGVEIYYFIQCWLEYK